MENKEKLIKDIKIKDDEAKVNVNVNLNKELQDLQKNNSAE